MPMTTRQETEVPNYWDSWNWRYSIPPGDSELLGHRFGKCTSVTLALDNKWCSTNGCCCGRPFLPGMVTMSCAPDSPEPAASLKRGWRQYWPCRVLMRQKWKTFGIGWEEPRGCDDKGEKWAVRLERPWMVGQIQALRERALGPSS